VLAASIVRAITLMLEAVTSVNFYQTIRRNNPEDSHLHNFTGYLTACYCVTFDINITNIVVMRTSEVVATLASFKVDYAVLYGDSSLKNICSTNKLFISGKGK
jgi:hypothetical protein